MPKEIFHSDGSVANRLNPTKPRLSYEFFIYNEKKITNAFTASHSRPPQQQQHACIHEQKFNHSCLRKNERKILLPMCILCMNRLNV